MPTSIRKTKLLLLSIAFVGALTLALAVVHWYAAHDSTTTVPPKTISGIIQVIDGDTVRTNGLRYRLVGFDAPETIDAKCPQERALG
jgi:endonuclease YncB( thermonuclease family)